MDFIFMTGKLRQGKTLAAIYKIKKYLEEGRLVATNCDIFLQHMFHRNTDKPRVMRVPDKPTLHDLEMIGRGRPKNIGYDESRNGLLVLDECGTWFNARNWQDKTRAEVNNWFLHAGKLGWDVILVVQDISIVDSQARSALAASIGTCKRLDKLSIPFITPLSKIFFDKPIRPAKLHAASFRDADGLFLDRMFYRGSHLYAAYDTSQIFQSNYPHGTHSILTPWHNYGRYSTPVTPEKIMRITKIYWKRTNRIAAAVIAFIAALFISTLFNRHALASKDSEIAVLKQKAGLAPEEKIDVKKKPKKLHDEFKGWHFDGSMHVNNSVTYYFLDDDNIPYTSHSMKMKQYQIVEHGFCLVELIKRKESIMLKCPKRPDPVEA